MKEEVKKIRKVKGNVKYAYAIAGVAVLVILCAVILVGIKNKSVQYIVQNGSIENTELSVAYVIKNETVIPKDTSKIIIPVVADGYRVSKGDIIATYKGTDYENYLQKIEQIDKEILNLMKDLPVVYSSEIENIENEINSLIKESNNENSYIKMQEYKTNINDLINKRAELIGSLSPDGAAVKDLIEQRNTYVESGKKSNDNIIASAAGIVSYKVDSLEDELDMKNIDELNINNVENSLKSIKIDNTKLKIVNNYEAYIITNISKKNAKYIEKNKSYDIKIIENNNYSVLGFLYKVNENADGYELVFKITNGIEYLVNEREIELEIVWWNNIGLFITNDAIYTYNNMDNVHYVKVIKYGEYVDIPVKVTKQNEKYSIVQNYTTNELKDLGLKKGNTLKIYDRLVVPKAEK